MNTFTVMGILIGVITILLGNALEGGHISSLLQGSAFLIVIGGTLGAVVVSHPPENIKQFLNLIPFVFSKPDLPNYGPQIFREWLQVSKKEGALGLQKLANQQKDPLLRMALSYLADGINPKDIGEILEEWIDRWVEKSLQASKVASDAGGFAPTMGILGAVLGLIHVMANLTDTSKLGGGIAVAFVATIYGVGFANLIFLPVGNHLRNQIHQLASRKKTFVQAFIAFAENKHPLVIAAKANYESEIQQVR